MFTRLTEPDAQAVRIVVEGREVVARAGDSVAAALLASGLDVRRETAVSRAKRAPYCMMGVCFDCLVTIDGVGNRQGCMTPVAEGMRVDLQRGEREFER
jgi:sarcosine oxidase subunit alpha